MKHRTAALAALLLAIALITSALSGCGSSGMSEDEIRQTYQTLVEASYPLNEIYYGEGIPFEHNEAVMAYLTGTSADKEGFKVSYMPAAEDAPYHSEAEIREATRAVYSSAMCEHLFTLAFEGVASVDGETVSFARYIEQSEILTVRIDLAEESITTGRTYDFEGMTLITDDPDRIMATFPSQIDGKPSVNVKISLVNTPEGWRLDSPTY